MRDPRPYRLGANRRSRHEAHSVRRLRRASIVDEQLRRPVDERAAEAGSTANATGLPKHALPKPGDNDQLANFELVARHLRLTGRTGRFVWPHPSDYSRWCISWRWALASCALSLSRGSPPPRGSHPESVLFLLHPSRKAGKGPRPRRHGCRLAPSHPHRHVGRGRPARGVCGAS